MHDVVETPANFLRPLTIAETWLEMALRSARSSLYLGSVFLLKQVIAQKPVTEGAEDVEEVIMESRQGNEVDRRMSKDLNCCPIGIEMTQGK